MYYDKITKKSEKACSFCTNFHGMVKKIVVYQFYDYPFWGRKLLKFIVSVLVILGKIIEICIFLLKKQHSFSKNLDDSQKSIIFATTNPTTLLVARPADQGGTFFYYGLYKVAYNPR